MISGLYAVAMVILSFFSGYYCALQRNRLIKRNNKWRTLDPALVDDVKKLHDIYPRIPLFDDRIQRAMTEEERGAWLNWASLNNRPIAGADLGKGRREKYVDALMAACKRPICPPLLNRNDIMDALKDDPSWDCFVKEQTDKK